jgi:hypothetical protein
VRRAGIGRSSGSCALIERFSLAGQASPRVRHSSAWVTFCAAFEALTDGVRHLTWT